MITIKLNGLIQLRTFVRILVCNLITLSTREQLNWWVSIGEFFKDLSTGVSNDFALEGLEIYYNYRNFDIFRYQSFWKLFKLVGTSKKFAGDENFQHPTFFSLLKWYSDERLKRPKRVKRLKTSKITDTLKKVVKLITLEMNLVVVNTTKRCNNSFSTSWFFEDEKYSAI